MNHRERSFEFLRLTGLTPVKIRPREKAAASDWDARSADKTVAEAVLREIGENPDLNLAALFHGKWVDLDLDSDDEVLKSLLDRFLPRTPFVWGRKSRPRSHRVFQMPKDFERSAWAKQLRVIKELSVGGKDLSVELRGGTHQNGLYAVLPGSIHPEGEEYEWEGGDISATPPIISLFRLLRIVRVCQAITLISTYWQPGVRNDMSLALAGLMWRIRQATLAIMEDAEKRRKKKPKKDEDEALDEDERFLLTDADAELIMKAVIEASDDDAKDARSRLLNFKNTWKKLAKDPSLRITGGVRFAELVGKDGPEVVRQLYRLLSDNPDIAVLEELSERFLIWYGQGVLIDLDLVRKGMLKSWMSREQANNSMGNERVKIGDDHIPVVPLLFSMKTIKRAMGFTFDPSTSNLLIEEDRGLFINQWRGFAVEPSEQRVVDEQMEPLLDYIKTVVAGGDEEANEWALSWLADIFQNPKDKPGTALVLVGSQGSGKTFLGRQIISKLLGKAHSAHTSSIQALTQKHNSDMANKMFLQCDEAIHAYQKDTASRLKSLITEDVMRVEPKNVDAYEVPNYMRYLFTSNEDRQAIFIDPSPHERRFTVLRVPEVRRGDLEYWDRMHQWTDANAAKMLRWLMDYPVNKKLIRRPYETGAKFEMQRQGMDAEVAWMVTRLAEGFPLSASLHRHWWHAFADDKVTKADRESDAIMRDVWPNLVHISTLEQDFKLYARQAGRVVYSGSPITLIRRVLPKDALEFSRRVRAEWLDQRTMQTIREKPRMYSFPSSEEIREHLLNVYGGIIDRVLMHEQERIEEEGEDFASEREGPVAHGEAEY